MNSKLKKLLSTLFLLLIFSLTQLAYSAELTFEIRADGLACPYCAYGIEKKFMAIKGVTYVDIKLKQGKVFVAGDDMLTFDDQQLKTLFNDAGFTYRSMKKVMIEQ